MPPRTSRNSARAAASPSPRAASPSSRAAGPRAASPRAARSRSRGSRASGSKRKRTLSEEAKAKNYLRKTETWCRKKVQRAEAGILRAEDKHRATLAECATHIADAKDIYSGEAHDRWVAGGRKPARRSREARDASLSPGTLEKRLKQRAAAKKRRDARKASGSAESKKASKKKARGKGSKKSKKSKK